MYCVFSWQKKWKENCKLSFYIKKNEELFFFSSFFLANVEFHNVK